MLLYLIKSSLILAILLSFYKLFLERESIHVFKRLFLLSSLVVAFGIPLITFTQYIEVPTQIINQTIESFSTTASTPNELPIEVKTNYLSSIIWSIYSLGVLLFGLKFIINLSEISRKIKRNEKVKRNEFTNILLQNLTVPHTFFNYLFFNKTKFETQQIPKEVFLHEQTHAKQKHSIDILFIEVLRVVFWFNPLLYFLKQSIKLNHEFLADTSVLKETISVQSYQKVLLEYSSNTESNILANAINYSLIKKRFTIMKKQTSKQSIWIRTFILLPILALLLYSFSNKNVVEKQNSATTDKIKNEIENINDLKVYYTISKDEYYKNVTFIFRDRNKNEVERKTYQQLTSSEKERLLPTPKKPIKINPSKKQLINWTNKNQFGVWHNGKRIENQALNNYNPNDIVLYYVSKLEKNAINYGKSYYQVNLYSIDYYNELYSTKQEPLSKSTKIYLTKESMIKAQKDTIGYKIINSKKYVLQTNKGVTRYWDMKGNGVDKNGVLLPKLPTLTLVNPTSKQLEVYNSAVKNYEEKHQVKIGHSITDNGEKIDIVEVFESPIKVKATLEQIREYNKIAKKYNSQSKKRSVIVKVKEVNRIKSLYNLMSADQRKNVVTFPTFPPQPPIKYDAPMRVTKRFYTYTNADGKEIKVELHYDVALPPPPPAIDASEKEKKNYQISVKEYKEWEKAKNIISKSASNDKTILPPPKSQLDHIIDMAKKSADFYFENKKISSDKAINIIKNSNKMNVLTKKIDSNKPQVFISSQPIP